MKNSLRLTTEDILNWSTFTGDFNVIHYEGPSPSKRPVQGMLSFIMLSDDALSSCANCDARSLAITVVFRRHVYSSVAHTLVNNGDNIKLLDDNGENTVSGQYLLKGTYPEWENNDDTELISIRHREIFKKYIEFNNRFPYTLSLTTFFNAMAFSAVVNSKSFLNFESYHFEKIEDYLDSSETLHTGQFVDFNIESYANLSHKNDVTILIQPSTVIKNGNDSYIRILNYRCLYGDTCLFTARTSLVSNMQ